MVKREEITAQFEKELKALLKKYDTEIELQDVGYAYQLDFTMWVHISSKWDKEGNRISESADINLGRYYDGN